MEVTTPSEARIPSRSVLRRLKLSPEVAWYLRTRGYELPRHPPLHKTPEGGSLKASVFDPERVDRVLRSMTALRHTQGRLAGKPLVPDSWQVAYFLAPVFGWVRENEFGTMVRVVRTAFMEVPRKNGKSTLSGGLGLYLTGADGEFGAQVIAAASTKSQAGFVFQPAKRLVEKSPQLRGRFRPLTDKIEHVRSGSVFQVISSAADAQHGANIHGAVVDELHVHKKRDLVDTIESGTGSREQPLVIFITTADASRPNTIYAEKRHTVEQLARGVLKDPSTFGVVFGLPDDADPLSLRNLEIANPGYPISPTRSFLETEITKARSSPALLGRFKRLHAGMRTRQVTAFLDLAAWDRNAGAKITESDLGGRVCVGGLDLGSTSDLTALCWLFPTGHETYDALWRFWTPEENLDSLDRRTAAAASREWVPRGWLSLTPGNVTDYDFVEQQILRDAGVFNVQALGTDMWGAQQVVNNLLAAGLPVVRVQQGFQTLSPALKEVQRLILKGKRGHPHIRHGGNPVMRWMVDNLAVATDAAGNVKPDKAHSGDKIDGVSALTNAISELINGNYTPSVYETRGVDTV